MLRRRSFIKQSLLGAGALTLSPLLNKLAGQDLQISLAQWSLHRTLQAGKIDNLDFPSVAKNDFGISVVEYVNQFFGGKKMNFREAAVNSKYLKELLNRSSDAGVINHLIMVDDEGFLALPSDKERLQAVDDHKKWVEAAKFIGCKTVRVNLHGKGAPGDKKKSSIDSLGRLGEFASPMEINIVVENHGGESSNGAWVAEVMQEVKRSNVGTLPDFGNFCLSHPWGTTQDGCSEPYDRYKGMEEMLPFAKGVSAKSYDFDSNGEQPLMDYKRLIQIVKNSGFKGYIGIEYEGNTQPEYEGIRKTLKLLQKHM